LLGACHAGRQVLTRGPMHQYTRKDCNSLVGQLKERKKERKRERKKERKNNKRKTFPVFASFLYGLCFGHVHVKDA
jgi:50S ribosomal subunit-associated GTPase HflX